MGRHDVVERNTYTLRFSKSQIPLIQPCQYGNISKGSEHRLPTTIPSTPIKQPSTLPLLEPSTYLYIPSNTYTHSIPFHPQQTHNHTSQKYPLFLINIPSTLVWKRKEKIREQSNDGATVIAKFGRRWEKVEGMKDGGGSRCVRITRLHVESSGSRKLGG